MRGEADSQSVSRVTLEENQQKLGEKRNWEYNLETSGERRSKEGRKQKLRKLLEKGGENT